jgi:glycosyltransferase involved in cell wall biosynthesis
MRSPHSISVILPVFNEEKNISSTIADALAQLERTGDPFEIIIINDGSTDKTDAIARSLSAANQLLRLVSHDRNRGYGAALRTGFAEAHHELVFLTDGDGQFSFAQLGEFLSFIDDFDAVIGYRAQRTDGWHRSLISRVGNWLARRTFHVHVRDIDCAYKLIRREALREISLGSDGTMISTELLAQAMLAGWRIKELPVSHQPREHGTATGAQPAVIWRTLVEGVALWRKQRRRH